MENKKPYLSPSSVEMFCRCAESWRRRYVLGDKIPPGVSLVRGISFHKGVEFNFGQKVNTRQDLPEPQINEVISSSFDDTIKRQGILLTKDEENVGKKKVLGQTKDATIRLGSLYRQKSAPEIQPLVVEDSQRIEIPDGSHDILGRLDLVDDQYKIRDYKTSGKKKNQSEIDGAIAMTMYALTFRRKFNRATGGLVWHVMVDKKEPEIQTLTTERTLEHVDALVARINAVLHGIRVGSFPPCPPGAWWCDSRYCGYHQTCKYVSC